MYLDNTSANEWDSVDIRERVSISKNQCVPDVHVGFPSARSWARRSSPNSRGIRTRASTPQAINMFKRQMLRMAHLALLPTPPMLYGSAQRNGSPSSRLDAHEN